MRLSEIYENFSEIMTVQCTDMKPLKFKRVLNVHTNITAIVLSRFSVMITTDNSIMTSSRHHL